MPSDVEIMGVYIPPLLAAWVVAMVASSLTATALERQGLAARFSHPPLAFFAMVVIFTVFFASTLFPA